MWARQSFASAVGGTPSQSSEAAFVHGLVVSLSASPHQEGQSGGVERVERDHHECAIAIRIKYAQGTYQRRVPGTKRTYVTDAGVAAWQHLTKNRAYRRVEQIKT